MSINSRQLKEPNYAEVSGCKIEAAAKSDLPGILALQKKAYLSEAIIYKDYSIAPLRQSLADVKREFEDHVFLKAGNGKDIWGSVRAFEKEGICYIGKLIVSPVHQNRGLGSKLLHKLEVMFPKADKFELFTGDKSVKNLHLYKKNGYEVTDMKTVSSSLTLLFLQKDNKNV